MNSSLSHLPEQKQQEIFAIAETLHSIVKPEMIILFGSSTIEDAKGFKERSMVPAAARNQHRNPAPQTRSSKKPAQE
ncbi:MAG: hypothetical protein JWN76_597, partial [Chitinophagaceae bacterium]|nr:hypothetical protein [Chitinophagaceae bacterium]